MDYTYYYYHEYIRDHIAFDVWSIRNRLDAIEAFNHESVGPQSKYYGYYTDELCSIRNYAADLWNELNHIHHFFGQLLPLKAPRFWAEWVENDFEKSGIVWFDTAASMSKNCNLIMMLLNEERIDSLEDVEGFIWKHTESFYNKRRNALLSLPKRHLEALLVAVFGFLTRYMELCTAFETVEGTIDILDEQQAMLQKENGETVLHEAAML